ncbi:MAG: AlpA family phage regulatory protein [Deltaproteobacteria bacterium]|jgi:prophage regulatory protein|nr:AlpA family phage regulatory protein [Deltaproteobacteria bacterium]
MSDIDHLVPDILIRAKQVAEITGLCLSTVYEYQRNGMFPGSVRLAGRTVAWSLNAVIQWVEDRKAGLPIERGHPVRRAASLKDALS